MKKDFANNLITKPMCLNDRFLYCIANEIIFINKLYEFLPFADDIKIVERTKEHIKLNIILDDNAYSFRFLIEDRESTQNAFYIKKIESVM